MFGVNTVQAETNHIATLPITTLPTITVEASRLGQTKDEVPAQVEIFTRADIAGSGAHSTIDFLEKRANINLRYSDNPVLAQVSMRGGGANGFGRVKIIVDGEELNNPDMMPQGLVRVPLESIERVEILHGAQCILQGGDASAGVINITSDVQDYEKRTRLEAHVGNLGRVGVHIGTQGGYEPDSVTYFADLDWDRSDGWRRNAWYEMWSVKGGVRKNFENGAWLALRTFYANSRYGLPGGLYEKYGEGSWQSRARDALDDDSRARNDIYGISLVGEAILNEENRLQSEFSFRNRQSHSYRYLDYDVYTLNYKLKWTNEHRFGMFDNRFDLGSDLKYDILYAKGYDAKWQSGGDNDFTRFDGALFARDEFYLCEEWSIFAGVRGEGLTTHDRYQSPAWKANNATDNSSQGTVAGEAGTNWRVTEDLKVFAKWSRFYHTPLADELFSSYGIPNLDLDPETGNEADVGIDWTILTDFQFSLTGFHIETDDEITYLNSGNVNLPDTTQRDGFETSFTWQRKHVGSAGILYTYTDAQFKEGLYEHQDVPLVPRQCVRLYGEYFLLDEFAVNGGYRFVGKQRWGGDFANEGGRLPSYGIFDIGMRYIPSWKQLEGFEVCFTMDNLFDKRYCTYGEYFGSHYLYPADGRTYVLSVRYVF